VTPYEFGVERLAREGAGRVVTQMMVMSVYLLARTGYSIA
jgi:hypothetical protein